MNRYPSSPLILLVDDDPTTIRVLEGLLRGAGFATLCAGDLAAAKDLACSRPVSLVLLDVHLPDGNGLSLCEQLAATGVPILFISASDDLATKVSGFAAGGVDYITKPLAGAEVLARVRTHLRLKTAFDSLAKLHEERLQRLAVSQQMLMPRPEDHPEAHFQVRVRQALSAGGDFYDVFPSGNLLTDYVVADASGHDLGVSLWTASFKTLLAEYGSLLNSPRDICRMINGSLLRLLPEWAYFTAVYARLNRASHKLTLLNAGHPPAILLSARTRCARALPQQGDLIGIFPDAAFDVTELPVEDGDRLFLYSDGLIESGRTPRDEGIARLAAACGATAGLALAEAVASITEQLGGAGAPEDDIVLLGVEI